MADTPYRWDGDNVILCAGFHRFTLAYIEPMANGRAMLAVYGWHPDGPHILPPQASGQEEREDLQGQGGEVEIVCMNKAEARVLVEAMFRVRGWEISAEKADK